MASLRLASSRTVARWHSCGSYIRGLTTSSAVPSGEEPLTHYRITLRRSAIALPKHIKGTLVSLGIHRRMQTVYHEHSPINAGKILAVKELVEVENVPASAIRTKQEQRQERKAPRGYKLVGSQAPQTQI
jgi:large subunit ribosomal protein L30